jgi:hypothetical protein
MFESVQIVRMHTLSWELSKKDLIRGKEMQFLLFKIGVERGAQALESLPGKGRCFKQLFGKDCKVCGASVLYLCNSHSYLYRNTSLYLLKCVVRGRKYVFSDNKVCGN